MPIQFRCSSCSQSIEVDDEHAGQSAQCPYCGRIVSVPAVSTIAPASVMARPPGVAPAQAGFARPSRFGTYSLALGVLVIILDIVATRNVPPQMEQLLAKQTSASAPAVEDASESRPSGPAAPRMRALTPEETKELLSTPGTAAWMLCGCFTLVCAILGVIFGFVGVARYRRDWRGWVGLLVCGGFLVLAVTSSALQLMS